MHPGWTHRTVPTPPHLSPDAVMEFTPWRNSGALLQPTIGTDTLVRRSTLDPRDVNTRLVSLFDIVKFLEIRREYVYKVFKRKMW